MSTFTVNMWIEIKADSIEEAWEIGESLPYSFLAQVREVEDAGVIDVEEI